MGNIKRLLVVLLVCMISIGCVACSGTTSEESSKVNLEDMTGSEKVDYFITKGGFLYQYGKDTMDILESAGKQESKEYSTAKLLNELGTDSIQMVKYVYRGIEKPDDSATISNIKQVKKSIEGLQ